MQACLFETPLPAPGVDRPVSAGAAPARRRRADADTLQRWWRLQGRARRAGRSVEPLLVTPDFLARIDVPCCPVTREPIGRSSAQVLPLRDDAQIAAGHLATVGPRAAAAPAGRWTDAWAEAERREVSLAARLTGNAASVAPRASGDDAAGTALDGALDARQWRRLALLRSFVAPLTPAEAAALPLHVLPPPRLRVLSPVQGLQVVLTLALLHPQRAAALGSLADATGDADRRQALRIFSLTLLARCPGDLAVLTPTAQRHALEDLWADALLARRWQRLALRLDDGAAERLLAVLQRALGGGRRWRTLPAVDAVDGWGLEPGSGNPRRARDAGAAADVGPLPSRRPAPLPRRRARDPVATPLPA